MQIMKVTQNARNKRKSYVESTEDIPLCNNITIILYNI